MVYNFKTVISILCFPINKIHSFLLFTKIIQLFYTPYTQKLIDGEKKNDFLLSLIINSTKQR